MRFFIMIIWVLISSIAVAQHQNIVIDNDRYNYPNEPSIKLDPKNPNRMIAASNINNYYISNDMGLSWYSAKLSSPHGVWGDPALAVDTSGAFYFFHLSNPSSGNWIDRIVCQKTENNGMTWTSGSYMGLNGTKAQDKEWPIVDRSNNNIYVTWTQFDKYGSSSSSDSSHIMFSRSFDAGNNWSPALRINKIGGDCIDDDDTVEGAVPAVGPNGEIYVSWAGPLGIVFDRSFDQGETWLDNEIFVTSNPGGWNYQIPGISRCNGLPVTVCDTSQSDFRGNIYINWTDQRNGNNDTDVWLIRSEDGGDTWSEVYRVNDDEPGKHQFLSWLEIDQTTGIIYVVFYDRRNYGDKHTDVYLARSTDGGRTFTNHIISEAPFYPSQGIFFGDYTNITVHDNIVRPIWTRLHEGKLSLWTAIIDMDILSSEEKIIPVSHSIELEQNYPNPFSTETYISFKLHQTETLDLEILNSEGTLVSSIFRGRTFEMGKHVLRISEKVIGLKPGVYFYTLKSRDGFFKKKMIQVKED